jgi:hypothetical protein
MKAWCCLTTLNVGAVVNGKSGPIADNDAIVFAFDGFAALQLSLK